MTKRNSKKNTNTTTVVTETNTPETNNLVPVNVVLPTVSEDNYLNDMAAAPAKVKKFTKRTNVPWQRKYYYLDMVKYAETEEIRRKKASQIQLMLKYMAENELTEENKAKQGDAICSGAIEKGYVKTKINPPVLFAYYRKDMEQLGLVFAGYNIA